MKTLIIVVAVALLSSCATQPGQQTLYAPVVDTQGKDMNKYHTDLQECNNYAAQVAGPGTGAAVGVAAGAVLGAALSSLLGGDRTSRNRSSAASALGGGLGGAGAGYQSEKQVVVRCLQGRGWNVLNP